ncbi:MAG TPA: S9 family peptidase [Longimicrobiales bacterium]|nr:S9 family peptidase [Longimicrobiales bacterium]
MTKSMVAAAAVVVGLFIPGGTAAQTALQPLTLESMSDNVSISTPLFSPDSRDLAITSDRSGRTRLWLIHADGSNARQLLRGDGIELGPAWSPDGSRLAFIRPGSDGSDIWLIGRDGGGLRRLTSDAESERTLSWSPDGARIAFLSDRAGHQDVWTVEVRTGELRQLTQETNPWDEFRWAPEWSPDGRWIAYVSSRSGQWTDDLWLVDVTSGASEKLTADVQVMSDPQWSPDGRHIAFNGVRYAEFWYGDQSDIYVVEMPQRSVRRVEMNTFVSDGNGGVSMQWGPQGERIFFRFEWEGDANLWSVPVEGGVATKLTYEVGSFGNFSISPDGRSIAYVRSKPVRGGEIHRVDLAGGEPRQLTDWYRNYADLKAPDRITFRSRDGHHILGYLYRPPEFDRTRRYPALVQVHGGGNNAYGNGFHALEHWLAARGYVVLAIEYRGSSGHGREFQDLAYGDWAAGQGWDAVAAAQFLDSLPYTTGRTGIYGGSYGGIMTLAALTRDASPFAAAAPLYGIYDWEAAYEDGDRLMRFWIIEGHRGFGPGEAPGLYQRTATLRQLDRIPVDLPFLIMHGERDRRAPYSQSVRLRDALQARGNPVRFHSYPEEGHGFRLRENRIHAYGELLDFFDHYLKSELAMRRP